MLSGLRFDLLRYAPLLFAWAPLTKVKFQGDGEQRADERRAGEILGRLLEHFPRDRSLQNAVVVVVFALLLLLTPTVLFDSQHLGAFSQAIHVEKLESKVLEKGKRNGTCESRLEETRDTPLL